jgi:hypothetical protein
MAIKSSAWSIKIKALAVKIRILSTPPVLSIV